MDNAPATARTASATKSSVPPTPPSVHGNPYCKASDFQFTAKPDRSDATYSPGQPITFDLAATYEGSTACDFTGAYEPGVTITNSLGQEVYVWRCTDTMCGHYLAKDPMTRGEVAFATTSVWRQDQCTQDSCSTCNPQCPPNPPAPPGDYTAVFSSDQVGTSNPAVVHIT